jgi:tryptophan synthase alpha chain
LFYLFRTLLFVGAWCVVFEVMNRIDAVFARRGAQGEGRAFVAYLTAGDPDAEASLKVMQTVSECGVDILEVGIPFSDPIADGPVIQAAFGRALAAGMAVDGVFELVRKLRAKSEMALVLFTYFNPVLQYGVERFAKGAKAAGADGVLILDLPVEASTAERSIFKSHGLHWVVLVAPTTPPERARRLAEGAGGFVYYVSREGVTGERANLAEGLSEKVRELKSFSPMPVCVGFGVSNRDHVREICSVADGVVVGSAIVRQVEKANASGSDPATAVKDFLVPLVHEAHNQGIVR